MHDIIKKIHWKTYSIGIAMFTLSCIATISASVFYFHVKNEQSDIEALSQQQRAANNHADAQLQIFHQYYPVFHTLKERGFIGNTRRLQWLETLKEIGEKYDIPSLDFTLEQARVATTPRDYYHHPNIETEVALMTLNLILVHEGDWFKLMTFLKNNARGLFSAEMCSLRHEGTGLKEAYTERLRGECKLEWYTTKDFSDSWEAI